VDKLDAPQRDVRCSTAFILGAQADLPECALRALVNKLKDTDKEVQNAAAEALGKQANLPEGALWALVDKIEVTQQGDLQEEVRNTAASALSSQANLTKEVLWALVDKLECPPSDIQRAAASILRNHQANLPRWAVRRIAALDRNNIRHLMSSMWRRLVNSLPKEAWKAPEVDVRSYPAKYLGPLLFLRLKETPALFLDYARLAPTENDKKQYFTYFLDHSTTPIYIDPKEGLPIEEKDIPLFKQAVEEFKQKYQLEDTQPLQETPAARNWHGHIFLGNRSTLTNIDSGRDKVQEEPDSTSSSCAMM
jgi:hypothetical protein